MYIPKVFKLDDIDKSIAFMQAYHFATLVSIKKEIPIATHLPFVIEKKEGKIILRSHLSKANEQWRTFNDTEVLIIFSEPHAYISPSLYQQKQEVPTWNYISIHVYGKVKILETDEEKIALLKQQMQAYEAEYIKQFNTLDKKYLNALLKEIIAFEIEVSDLQAKEKLSQNKSKADRLSVKQHLQQSDDTIQQNLGKYMLLSHDSALLS